PSRLHARARQCGRQAGPDADSLRLRGKLPAKARRAQEFREILFANGDRSVLAGRHSSGYGPADAPKLSLKVPHAGLAGVRANDLGDRALANMEDAVGDPVFLELPAQ